MFIVLIFICLVASSVNTILEKKTAWLSVPIVVLLLVIIKQIKNLPEMIPDYQNYWWAFQRAVNGDSNYRYEWGYKEASIISAKLGWDFPYFNEMLLISSIVLLFIAVKRFNGDTTTFFSIYAITFFFIDIVQVRNTLSFAIILALLSMVNKAKSIIIYSVIGITIGMLFQNIGIFYALVPIFSFRFFGNQFLRNALDKIMLYVNIVGIVFVSFLVLIPSGKHILVSVASKLTTETYAYSLITNYNLKPSFLIIAIVVSAMIWYYGNQINKKFGLDLSIRQKVLLQFLTVQIYAVPLMLLIVDFQRVVRSTIIIVIIFHSILMNNPKYKTNFNLRLLAYILIFLGAYEFVIKFISNTVIIPIVQNILF